MGRVSEAPGRGTPPPSQRGLGGRQAAGAMERKKVWGSYKLGSDLGVYEPWAQATSLHLSDPQFLHL